MLVVDNYSTDATADEIAAVAAEDSRVQRIVPAQRDHGIGGCWNEAVRSPLCGRYACQLDSDDLYADSTTLQRIVDLFRARSCAMVVGSYRLVDFDLQELPPGIIDHREWTPHNGRNNLLRVQWIGAPRAYVTSLLRQHPFPDVSYGEDYAIALRLSRDYLIERLYDPIYLCRRWAHNSDANLDSATANRFATYKDMLRSREIAARQVANARRREPS